MSPELLATHRILSLFETSKSRSDEILDNLPGVFFNFDAQGNILRANKVLAAELLLNNEDVLGAHVKQMFSSSAWNLFKDQMELVTRNSTRSIEFELPLAMSDGSLRDFLWQITPMVHQDSIFTCIGRDISDVKAALSKTVTLTKDLEVAEKVQGLLLPQERELTTPQFHMAAHYNSADISGGDFWTFGAGQDKAWLLVGDVTGHGAGPAMVTAMVAGCVGAVRTLAEEAGVDIDIPHLIQMINKRLRSINDQPYWMTVAAVTFDFKASSLTWWSAGAPPLMVWTKDNQARFLTETSTPLGAGDVISMGTGTFELERGDRALLVTDGILEMENPAGVQLGSNRLRKTVERHRDLNAVQLRERLLELIRDWGKGLPAGDDMTIVILDRV